MKYERYIQLGLMILLYLGFLSRPLSMLVSWLSSGMFRIISLLPFL